MESMRENTLLDENTDCDANTLPGDFACSHLI